MTFTSAVFLRCRRVPNTEIGARNPTNRSPQKGYPNIPPSSSVVFKEANSIVQPERLSKIREVLKKQINTCK